jgi:hypothetical protein
MDHSDIDGKGQPIVHFEEETSGSALSDGIAVCTNGVFALDDDAAGSGVVEIICEEVGDPIVDCWVDVFFVFGDFDDVLVALFFKKFVRGIELFITCPKV